MNPLLWTATRTQPSRRAGAAAPATAAAAIGGSLERRAPAGGALARRRRRAGEADPRRQDLVVTFPGPDGPIDVVKGVSFSVPAGEVVGDRRRVRAAARR